MTREEAIKALEKWGVLLPSDADEALDMAIEALQFQDIMENMPYTAKPTPEVCEKCKERREP